MKDFEEDFEEELEFDFNEEELEEFTKKMQEFGEKMEKIGKKIGKNIQKVVEKNLAHLDIHFTDVPHPPMPPIPPIPPRAPHAPSEPWSDAHRIHPFILIIKDDGCSFNSRKNIQLLVQSSPHIRLHQCSQSININLGSKSMRQNNIRLGHDISMDLARLLRSKNKRNAWLSTLSKNSDQSI